MHKVQLNFFTHTDELELLAPTAGNVLPDILCWTKMQAESGEKLKAILHRKEMERRAGDGVFFWGIGNAVNAGNIASSSDTIRLVFSKMLSKPKHHDEEPDEILVWRKYAVGEAVYSLPSNVLVTSRANTPTGPKQRHFALVCYSDKSLEEHNRSIFDPKAYRNVSEKGGSVGFSQVTSLLRKVSPETQNSKYLRDIEAKLIWPFVVRLLDPIKMPARREALIGNFSFVKEGWIDLVSAVRQLP